MQSSPPRPPGAGRVARALKERFARALHITRYVDVRLGARDWEHAYAHARGERAQLFEVLGRLQRRGRQRRPRREQGAPEPVDSHVPPRRVQSGGGRRGGGGSRRSGG